MHLYTEARAIAKEAIEQVGTDFVDSQEFIWQSCEWHECAIYHGKAIYFCATHNTDDGEQWLEDCGGVVQPGDSFGAIACRIAFATLYCAAIEAFDELISEAGDAA